MTIKLHCPSCQRVPPPLAMETNWGKRQPDGTYSLVCPTCGILVVDGIVYEGVPGHGTISTKGS